MIGGLVPWSNDGRKLYSVKANRERTRIASGKSYYSSAFLGLRCVSIYPFRPIFVPLTGPRHKQPPADRPPEVQASHDAGSCNNWIEHGHPKAIVLLPACLPA